MATYDCEPGSKQTKRARWWKQTAAQKQQLVTALKWTNDYKKHMDKLFSDTVRTSKPHKKPTNNVKYSQMLKEKRALWSKTHGVSEDQKKLAEQPTNMQL